MGRGACLWTLARSPSSPARPGDLFRYLFSPHRPPVQVEQAVQRSEPVPNSFLRSPRGNGSKNGLPTWTMAAAQDCSQFECCNDL